MLKRSITLSLLVVCLLLALPLAASADVIDEPRDDFYSRHSDECSYLGRSFFANGEKGYVSMREEPGSRYKVADVENGDILYIEFTYDHKGDTWGVAEINTEDDQSGEWLEGWIPMDQLLPVYDYISFEEEHRGELYPYTGGYDELNEPGDIVFWTWPGSGEIAWTLKEDDRDPETDSGFLVAEHAYKDSEGREWGFFTYVYAMKNTWVCLSDPSSTDIQAFSPPPQPELLPPASSVETSGGGIPAQTLIIILVAVLVVGTVILIRIFWKPKKKNS